MLKRRVECRRVLVCGAFVLVSIACWWGPGITTADASGFFTGEIGARAAGKGGANFVGEDSLTAVYINPAALYRVKGTNAMAQVDFDVFHTYYRREPYLPSQYNRNPADYTPSLFLGSDLHMNRKFSMGYAAYGPYGVTTRYPDDSQGRYNSLDNNAVQVNHILAAGWKPLDWLAIGGGIGATSFKLENFYGFSVLGDRTRKYDVKAQFLVSKDFVPSWNAGVIISPVPWFEFGGSYIPRFDNLIVEGYVKAELPEFYSRILGYSTYKDDIKVTIIYPEQYRGGARYIHDDLFDVEVGVTFMPLSLMKGFVVDLKDETLIQDFFLPLNWEDSWSYRVGTSWNLGEHWRARGGYFFEEGAAPPETLGSGSIETDRNGFAGGFTVSYFGVTIDWTYTHIFLDDAEVPGVNDPDNVLDDGRGRIKGNYDRFIGAVNFNIEKMYYTYKGRGPKK